MALLIRRCEVAEIFFEEINESKVPQRSVGKSATRFISCRGYAVLAHEKFTQPMRLRGPGGRSEEFSMYECSIQRVAHPYSSRYLV